MVKIQQGVGNIPQRFWSILTWKHHAVAADLSAAHPWCKSLVPPHPKGALLDWDLVTVEAIWVKWTHCHVQETSLRWFELCDMVHYPAVSSIRRWVNWSHKGMDMVSKQHSGRLWRLNDAQLVLRGLKCAKKVSPTPLHHHHQSEPLRQGRMDPCFHVIYAKFWPYHLNVAAEIETHQTRHHFSNLLLSHFGEPV